MWVLRSNAALTPFQSDLFYDLSSLDCLNFEDEKWSDTIHDLYSKNGNAYAMRAEAAEPREGLFFNKRLLTEAGIDPESIYEMQANGTWTWDAFEDLCKKLTIDTDNDGIPNKYAMMSFSKYILKAALVSNGVGMVMKDENGLYVNAAESDAFLEAANWVVDMLSKYEMPAPEGAEWNYFESAFINGEVALQAHQEYVVSSFSQMEDEYGFVMFPKGPKADTYLFAPEDNVFVIPACYDAERAWKIAFAFNLFTNPTPGYEDTDDWMNNYFNSFSDERAVRETLAMMRESDHQFVWFADMIPGYDMGEQYMYDVYAREVTPAEQAEAMRGTWQAYLDTANGK